MRPNLLSRLVFAPILLGLCVQAWSANTIDPEPGMWGFDGEVNGQPGRGVQIDQQGGDLLIVTYFGYRSDGSALFLQAAGARTDDRFRGELVEYENGRTIGGPQVSGRKAGSVGTLAIAFDSETSARITLPGEPERRITRLQFENVVDRFKRSADDSYWGVYANANWAGLNAARITFTISEPNIAFKIIKGQGESTVDCMYTGSYVAAGKGLDSSGIYSCMNNSDGRTWAGRYLATGFSISRESVFTGALRTGFDDELPTQEPQQTFYAVCARSGPVFLGTPRCRLND